MKNSKKCKRALTNREYKIYLKSYKVYCPTCNKRCGVFDAYCGPKSNSYKKSKNWKEYRQYQWK
jgi:hypothetical protein